MLSKLICMVMMVKLNQVFSFYVMVNCKILSTHTLVPLEKGKTLPVARYGQVVFAILDTFHVKPLLLQKIHLLWGDDDKIFNSEIAENIKQ